MKRLKTIALVSVSGVALFTVPAHADNYANMNGFTSHHLVDGMPYEGYAESLPADDKIELHQYLNYEQREPCQHYQPVPDGFIEVGCELKPIQQETHKTVTKTVTVLKDYTINFGFDKDNIETSEMATVERIADEIKHYNPSEVLVAGHTDTSGSDAYNQDLSKRRAMAVSEALTKRGVKNRVLDERAYGENQPAVETGDGVRLRANRRVFVQFIK